MNRYINVEFMPQAAYRREAMIKAVSRCFEGVPWGVGCPYRFLSLALQKFAFGKPQNHDGNLDIIADILHQNMRITYQNAGPIDT